MYCHCIYLLLVSTATCLPGKWCFNRCARVIADTDLNEFISYVKERAAVREDNLRTPEFVAKPTTDLKFVHFPGECSNVQTTHACRPGAVGCHADIGPPTAHIIVH